MGLGLAYIIVLLCILTVRTLILITQIPLDNCISFVAIYNPLVTSRVGYTEPYASLKSAVFLRPYTQPFTNYLLLHFFSLSLSQDPYIHSTGEFIS